MAGIDAGHFFGAPGMARSAETGAIPRAVVAKERLGGEVPYRQPWTKAELEELMEAVVSRGNLMLAYEWVMRNKGSAGVDGIGITEFKVHLQ